jgi:hypothetical protein
MSKAWHFVSDTLRDGRPVPADGEVLVHKGPLKLCASGLHASKNILDALQYAPGSIICRVEVGGEIIHGCDKLVCSERTILWRASGEQVLGQFARMCALDVLHLWDAPDIVVQYLKTGDESIRAAARDASDAADAAGSAIGAAAWAATRDAAWAAARATARDAARATARDAAWAAARDAARDAARAAGRAAGGLAGRAADRDATWAVVEAAAAARDAAGAKQSRRLARMVRAAA